MVNLIPKLIILSTFIGIGILCTHCVPRDESDVGDIHLDVTNPDFMNVVDAEVNQDKLGLLSHMREPNPSVRYQAVSAFSSFQDSTVVDSISQMLKDPITDIREVAAYSLGQLGSARIVDKLKQTFIQKDTGSIDLMLNHNILEAIGKIGTAKDQSLITDISTYRDKDTNLLLGQARSLYRFALRGITSQASTKRMVNMVLNGNLDNKVRTVAAHYLMRAKDIDIAPSKFQLLRQLATEENPNVKMALALAMSKEKDPELIAPLLDVLDEATDYRVKCNLLRGLESYRSDTLTTVVLSMLLDNNIQVAKSAGNHLIRAGNPDDIPLYRDFLNQNLMPQVRAKLMEAILTNVHPYFTKTREFISYRIVQEYNSVSDIYDKQAYIQALAADPKNYRTLCTMIEVETMPAVLSSLMGGLVQVTQDPRFDKNYTPSEKRYALRYIAKTIESVMRKGDIGAITFGAAILNDRKLNLKDIGRLDFSYLDTIRQAIPLPEGLEAYNALIPAANYVLDTTFTSYTAEEGKKVNWSLLESLGDSSYVKIITSKGDIDFRFFTKESPATVSNFISLANDNFYDNKNFHRVVPNFVIQGGCTRGDGYGSPGFSIRSELGPLYYDSEGMVGMASAGPHTESAQFFITHSPAMHLDGKYTIFGKVIQGMDVVHAIQEGDIIEDVQIRND